MNKILEGKLILLASHNPLDIDLLCDCVYELDAETIVSQRRRAPAGKIDRDLA